MDTSAVHDDGNVRVCISSGMVGVQLSASPGSSKHTQQDHASTNAAGSAENNMPIRISLHRHMHQWRRISTIRLDSVKRINTW